MGHTRWTIAGSAAARWLLPALVLLMAAAGTVTATEVLNGTCVGVPEADRIEVWLGSSHGVVTVLLDGVDGESLRQHYGHFARSYVEQQVRGKAVTVEVHRWLGTRQAVGRVIVGRRDLAYEVLAEGLARYDGLAPSGQRLVMAEDQARRSRRGLWGRVLPTPTPVEEGEREVRLSDIAWQVDQRRARDPWPTPTPAGTPDPTIEISLQTWIGAQQAELIAAWGQPSRVEGDGRGGTILVYDRYVDGEGNPVAIDGDSEGAVLVLSELFFVDPEGRIYHRMQQLPSPP